MERHMEGIEVTMPFTRTGRLQYSSRQSVGERHFTAPSTFGFIDPLYSNGLIHTFESVYYGARHLLSAFGKEEGPVKKGDFSTAAFAKMGGVAPHPMEPRRRHHFTGIRLHG